MLGVFFFFKQKTAYEITTGDWSSDVCSSDLKGGEAGPHEVEGIGASSFIPPVLDLSLANEIIQIEDEPAFAMVKRLARDEGILGGSSAGANVAAALQVAKKLGAGKRVVTLIPDPAER